MPNKKTTKNKNYYYIVTIGGDEILRTLYNDAFVVLGEEIQFKIITHEKIEEMKRFDRVSLLHHSSQQAVKNHLLAKCMREQQKGRYSRMVEINEVWEYLHVEEYQMRTHFVCATTWRKSNAYQCL